MRYSIICKTDNLVNHFSRIGISTEQQKKTWLINWYFENDPTSSIYLATLRNPALVASYQTSPGMLYGTPFATGMENYFQKIKAHFGQSMFDQLLTEFAQQSNLYVDEIKVDEWHIYGSARLGVYEANKILSKRIARDLNNDNQITTNEYIIETPEEVLYLYASYQLERGAKRYELANHLGNVLTVISDKKTANFTGSTFTNFTAERISATDYSPFGAPLAGRTWNGGEYRFAFNGQEKDDEVSGDGNSYTAEFWQYDPRLGRRFNIDPKPNPSVSCYATFNNNPIGFSDPLGDTIRISYAGKDRQLEQLTYSPGMKYTGDNAFLSETVSALNEINEGVVGGGMIGELNSSEKDITINQHSRNVAEGLNVGFNPYSTLAGINQNGETTTPNFISLGHELAHTWDELKGTIDMSPWLSPEITQAEKFATHIENQLRAEHNLPLRTHYGLSVNPDGSYSGFGRLIKGNESLFYQQKMTIEMPNAALIDDGSKSNNLEFMIPFRYK